MDNLLRYSYALLFSIISAQVDNINEIGWLEGAA
jgi:hypothetical protein